MSSLNKPLYRIALTLLAAVAGGWIANWFNLPLAWMIGAMAFTALPALLGAPMLLPNNVRAPLVVVLGVMIGTAFTPAILSQMPQWGLVVAIMPFYLITALAAGYYFMRRAAGFDMITSYFSAVPGGVTGMILLGEAMGGDVRAISITQSLRVVATVTVIPVYFQITGNYERTAADPFSIPDFSMSTEQVLVILGCGSVGYLLGRIMKIPTPELLGPMLVTSIVYLAGFAAAPAPEGLVIVAQIVLGASIGARFAGTTIREAHRLLGIGVFLATIILFVAYLFSMLAGMLAPEFSAVALLAFAPGGLAEMTLISLALGLNTALVSAMHVLRFGLVLTAAPGIFHLIRRYARPGHGNNR